MFWTMGNNFYDSEGWDWSWYNWPDHCWVFIVLAFKLLRVIIKDTLAKHSFTCKYFHHYLAINLAPFCPLIALKMKMNMNLKFG